MGVEVPHEDQRNPMYSTCCAADSCDFSSATEKPAADSAVAIAAATASARVAVAAATRMSSR
jgi:hypothetical protein